jgi:hypothetical protein
MVPAEDERARIKPFWIIQADRFNRTEAWMRTDRQCKVHQSSKVFTSKKCLRKTDPHGWKVQD